MATGFCAVVGAALVAAVGNRVLGAAWSSAPSGPLYDQLVSESEREIVLNRHTVRMAARFRGEGRRGEGRRGEGGGGRGGAENGGVEGV